MTEQPRLIGIDRLCRQEREACLIAVRVLEVAEAEAWDVGGRQGAVDVMLTLEDGRKAAFEVTNLAAEGALKLAMLLAKDNHKWSVPGAWFWTIEIGSLEDLGRLKGCYDNIIRICEGAGVAYPEEIGWSESADPDLQWLVQVSLSVMIGYPEQLAKDMKNPGAMVVPRAGGGVIDESMTGFAAALSEAFKRPHIQEHFDKLARADADERHLFIPLHDSALPFGISSELVFEDTLPPEPPPVPDSVTHLWLAPAGSRRVLLWSRGEGWRNFPTKAATPFPMPRR
jgi:hypothetical protein